MKITQDENFKPITITLETQGDADAFVTLLEQRPGVNDDRAERLKSGLLDWFSKNHR